MVPGNPLYLLWILPKTGNAADGADLLMDVSNLWHGSFPKAILPGAPKTSRHAAGSLLLTLYLFWRIR